MKEFRLMEQNFILHIHLYLLMIHRTTKILTINKVENEVLNVSIQRP